VKRRPKMVQVVKDNETLDFEAYDEDHTESDVDFDAFMVDGESNLHDFDFDELVTFSDLENSGVNIVKRILNLTATVRQVKVMMKIQHSLLLSHPKYWNISTIFRG